MLNPYPTQINLTRVKSFFDLAKGFHFTTNILCSSFFPFFFLIWKSFFHWFKIQKMKCQTGPNLVPQGASFSNLSRFSAQSAFAKPPQLHQDNWNISPRRANHKNKYQSRHIRPTKRRAQGDTKKPQTSLKYENLIEFNITFTILIRLWWK